MKLSFRKTGGGDGDLLVTVAAEPEALVVTTRKDGSRTKRTIRTPVAKLPNGDVSLAAMNRRAELVAEGYVEEGSDPSGASHHYYLVIQPGSVEAAIEAIREQAETLKRLPDVDVLNVEVGVLVRSRDGTEKIRVSTAGDRTGLLGKGSSVTVVGLWLVALGYADVAKEGEKDPEGVSSGQAKKLLRSLSVSRREIGEVLDALGMDESSGVMGDWPGARSYEAVLL